MPKLVTKKKLVVRDFDLREQTYEPISFAVLPSGAIDFTVRTDSQNIRTIMQTQFRYDEITELDCGHKLESHWIENGYDAGDFDHCKECERENA